MSNNEKVDDPGCLFVIGLFLFLMFMFAGFVVGHRTGYAEGQLQLIKTERK